MFSFFSNLFNQPQTGGSDSNDLNMKIMNILKGENATSMMGGGVGDINAQIMSILNSGSQLSGGGVNEELETILTEGALMGGYAFSETSEYNLEQFGGKNPPPAFLEFRKVVDAIAKKTGIKGGVKVYKLASYYKQKTAENDSIKASKQAVKLIENESKDVLLNKLNKL